ncbi:MAG: DUF748 domain-containing protein [Nitrospirae bacterium]|nr:MAG: DUF748 domain-containing protein [Nitrospirota bacterium]
MNIKIDQIALSDFYSRLIVNADGSLNVQGIVVKQSDNKSAGNDNSSLAPDKPAVPDNASAAAPKKMVRINSLSLQGGTVNFSDRHIKPNYSANLLEIGGRVSGLSSDENTLADIERDTEGLRQSIFQRKLKAKKHKELLKKGAAPSSVDMVKIEKEEHLKYLTMAYKEDKFPKPRNMVGLLKDLPAPEMQKLMLTHIVVKEDDLRFLAAQRALKVKEHISKSKQVEQERVFLVEPKSLQPEKKEKLKDSRVDFRLK